MFVYVRDSRDLVRRPLQGFRGPDQGLFAPGAPQLRQRFLRFLESVTQAGIRRYSSPSISSGGGAVREEMCSMLRPTCDSVVGIAIK